MGTVVPKGQLFLNYLRGSYPYQVQPTIHLPDNAINAAIGNCVDLQDMVVDQNAGCIYPKPRFVPHNQQIMGGAISGTGSGELIDADEHLNTNVPNWVWDGITINGGAAVQLQAFQGKPHAHQVIDCVFNSDNPPTLVTYEAFKTEVENQGFLALLTRTIESITPAGSQPSWELRWVIKDRMYSLLVNSSEYAQFRSSAALDGLGPWKMLAAHLSMSNSPTQSLGNAPPQGGQPQIAVSVVLLNKRLLIRFGGMANPYDFVVDRPGDPPVITSIRALASVFTQFSCEVHPIKWHTEGGMRSNPLDLGFAPANTPYYYITGIVGQAKRQSGDDWSLAFPNSSKVTVTRVGATTDINQQYDLLIENEAAGEYAGVPFADFTGAVVRVAVHVDGIISATPTVARPVIPKSIQEQMSFDPNGLTVNSNLTFELDNYHGQWRGQSGNIAVQYNQGYASPFTPMFPRFTGMCGRYSFNRPDTNKATVTFQCQSLMRLLQRPIFSPPIMDFWNHYYAISFLAQMGGITPAQMAFAALVPSDPFQAAGGDPAPYWLPAGLGNRPWTPRGRESSIRSLMDYIRKPGGFLLYFDAQGYLRYEPWIPPSAGAVKKVFTEGATGSDGLNLSEFWNFRLTSDIEQVRNQVFLIGIDPFDPRPFPIVSRQEDLPSIKAPPGSEPQNYKGYPDPFVWTDSRFASQSFATQSSLNIFKILRIPGVEVEFTCWLQPQLYPMDVISIQESRSGSEGVPFYILSMSNSWAYRGTKQVSTSTIRAKYLV